MKKDNEIILKIISDYEIAIIKIILYCLTELPFPLRINKTISVLKGIKSTFVIDHQLNKLSTFSVLSSFSKEQLSSIINILIELGLIIVENISIYNNMPIIKITDTGKKHLTDNTEIQIQIIDTLTDKDITEFNKQEYDLFIELRELRRRLAQQNNLPAYTVCSDQVLREITIHKPIEEQQLLKIKGVGEKFIDKYGSLFIETINNTDA